MPLRTEILYGKPVSTQIKQELAGQISTLAKKGVKPGLAVVMVGDDPASSVYVRSKSRAFAGMSCYSKTFHLAESTSEIELIQLIEQLNNTPEFHGILVQLPLPSHINSRKITHLISPEKDVDGFHPVNLGYLFEGCPKFIPCTPHGILKMLSFYNIDTTGKHAVILGRSNIVGKPMSALLSGKTDHGNATVTICHTCTVDLGQITKTADIIIAASGVPGLITGSLIREGVHIIDVGINRVQDSSEKGYKIVGDVDFDSVQGIARSVSPVPGGVGPLTITMLLYNTVKAARNLRP